MAFIEELNEYRDPIYGLLGDGLSPKDPSGNSALYEAHAFWIAQDHGETFWAPLYSIVFRHLDSYSGTIHKKPHPAKDIQTYDDYVGLTSASPSFAGEVVNQGRRTFWFYDDRNPSVTFWEALWDVITFSRSYKYLEYFHGRSLGLPQHYKISAGESPSILGWTAWYLSIWLTTMKPGNESAWLLDYLKLRVAEKHFPKHWAVKKAISRYQSKLAEHGYRDIAGVYSVYFSPVHPFAHYSVWPKT